MTKQDTMTETFELAYVEQMTRLNTARNEAEANIAINQSLAIQAAAVRVGCELDTDTLNARACRFAQTIMRMRDMTAGLR